MLIFFKHVRLILLTAAVLIEHDHAELQMLRIVFYCFSFSPHVITSVTICSQQVSKCSCGCFVLYIYETLCDKSRREHVILKHQM